MNLDKDFVYYLRLPVNKMGTSNILSLIELDDEMRLGLFYLMSVYHLGFHHVIRGSWEWIFLSKGEDGEMLTGQQITEMEADMEVYNKLNDDFNKGILPDGYKKSPKAVDFQYTAKYGWLSPTGEFTVSDWGDHEQDAFKIVQDKGFEDEYDNWENTVHLCRDFLCIVKGYLLIHNPSLDGGYIVTNTKSITKKQREFLYDYFTAIGNGTRASMYLNGDE